MPFLTAARTSPPCRLSPELGEIQARFIQWTRNFLRPDESCAIAPVSSSLQLPHPRTQTWLNTGDPQCKAVSSASSSFPLCALLLCFSLAVLAWTGAGRKGNGIVKKSPHVSGVFILQNASVWGVLQVDSFSHGVTVDCSVKPLPCLWGSHMKLSCKGTLAPPTPTSVRPPSLAASAP